MLDQGVTIIDQIIDRLFGKYDTEFQKNITSLCDRMGRDEHGTESLGFIYNGKWYVRRNSPNAHRRHSQRKALPLHLVPEMDKIHREYEIVQTDRRQINQLLVKLLYQCNDLEEIRDALPNSLWVYAGFSGHQRQFNQEVYFFKDERLQRDYERLLPKIELYLGMSLIL